MTYGPDDDGYVDPTWLAAAMERARNAPRWHQMMGVAARRDRSVPLLIEPEQCDSVDPDHGRCAGIRNHRQMSDGQHGNERGHWW